MNWMPVQGGPLPGPGQAGPGPIRTHASPTQAELAAMEEFIGALLEDRAPGVAEHLERYPELADSLRPVLEGAELFHREYHRLKRKYPGYSLGRMFGLQP